MFATLALLIGSTAPGAEPADRPNFVIFFVDDLGYHDLGCYGAPRIKTPNLDRLAAEGTRFTSFYVQPVCGVSRAALMTGCYPIRVAEPGNTKEGHPVLHPQEITLAEVLKEAGYRTALVGKWHLAGGRREEYPGELMPGGQGFDSFFGTPLHNGFTRTVQERSFRTQLMRDNEILDDFLDQEEMDQLTTRYTDEAVRFIRENCERPFFLYLAHNMPHVPLGVSDKFRGKSEGGRYGDVVEELDWSAGEILKTLQACGLDERTLVVFTSDNGPWIESQLAGEGGIDAYYGSAAPLRGAKMMTWDGGLRVPCLVRWPGRVPAGNVCDQLASSMDLMPTFAKLAGAALPQDRVIDGRDIWPLMAGEPGATTPHEAFYYYAFVHLQAVRSGDWKLVLPRPAKPPWTSWSARLIEAVPAPQLYNLASDISEQQDVAPQHPDVVERLMQLVERGRDELGDYHRIGRGARFFDPGPKRRESARWLPPPEPEPADNAEPTGNLRFDFESGDLQDWAVVEGRFDLIVCDRAALPAWPQVPFNKQGKFHLSTVATREGKGTDDAMTGVLESPVFTLRGDRMSFLVGGGNSDQTFVALVAVGDEERELLRAGGTNSPVLRRVVWDVSGHRGVQVVLRVVDRKQRVWAHLTFDDFSCEGEIDVAATRVRRAEKE